MKLNPFAWSFRIQYLFGFIVCAALIAYALYADKILGFDPCPLCIFQRVAFAALGVVGLLGALHPTVLKQYDLVGPVIAFEIDCTRSE